GAVDVWSVVGPGNASLAMKFLPRDQVIAEVEARALQFMPAIHHPHLLPTTGIWAVGEFLSIGMELADETLWDRHRRAEREGPGGIPAEELLRHMGDAAEG